METMENKLVKTIESLYNNGIYTPFAGLGGEYVDVIIGEGTLRLPCRNALLAVLFSAKENNFTGKVTVDYGNQFWWGGGRDQNDFYFENGKPTTIDYHCSKSIYGQEHWKNGN